MSSSTTTKVKPKMLVKETLYKTKKYCNKTLGNLKSLVLSRRQKLPKNPIFCTSKRVCTKRQELNSFYTSFSDKWDSTTNKVVEKKEGQHSPKVRIKKDEEYSKSSVSIADCNEFEDLKQEKKEGKYVARKQRDSSFRAADALARKMKELDMMDVNDMDHVMDVEEVLHYYSRLTCPAYLEIVDNFFVDMYSEFHVPQPSRSVNNSMRKLGSASVHSSMRSLGPLKL
ncbi:hypothetical protein ABFX02_09G102200 [Erythranthe guttata]